MRERSRARPGFPSLSAAGVAAIVSGLAATGASVWGTVPGSGAAAVPNGWVCRNGVIRGAAGWSAVPISSIHRGTR